MLRKVTDAMIHIQFAVEPCVTQHMIGKLFMFEHPVAASSWSSEAREVLGGLEGVLRANFDFCVLGMRVGGHLGSCLGKLVGRYLRLAWVFCPKDAHLQTQIRGAGSCLLRPVPPCGPSVAFVLSSDRYLRGN